MSTNEPNELVAATQTLAERVHELGERIALSEQSQREIKAHQVEIASQGVQQAKNVAGIERANKRLTRYLLGLLGLGILALVAAGLAWKANDNVHDQQVRSCQNANQTRQGQTLLWDTLINKSLELNQAAGAPKKDIKQLIDLRTLENRVFAQRDCSDLTRKYPLPSVPDSLKTK